MGGSKNVKEPNEKKIYIKGLKFKNWVVQKMKGMKNLANYIKWKP
jgi:hypothetical protein